MSKELTDALNQQTPLFNNIAAMTAVAARDCTCGGVGKPKCRVCLAREYLAALERMAGRGMVAIR